MRWIGILFKGWTMRAIREDRKTVTRRIGDRYAAWRPGDRLWCRETFAFVPSRHQPGSARPLVEYRADRSDKGPPKLVDSGTWRPGIHMPLGLCREFLEIVSVEHRVESPLLIDEAEARREGVADLPAWRTLWSEIHPTLTGRVELYRVEFRRLPFESAANEARAYGLQRMGDELRKSERRAQVSS